MKKFVFILAAIFSFSILVPPVFAQSTAGVESYTKDTLDIIVLVASLASILFLIKGGYRYITSSGNPQALEQAKKTIKRALIGLVIVLSAGFIVSTLNQPLQLLSRTGR
jgi:membrane protease YdiL (CAAX protease family)